MPRRLFDPEHESFGDAFRAFLTREVLANYSTWEKARVVSRAVWTAAGNQGFLCMDVPEEYGGSGVTDFRYNLIITEELSRVGAAGVGYPLHTDIVVPYLTKYGSAEQKRRWLPAAVAGDCITAIAMSEPAAGSDLQGIQTAAIRQGDHYLLNGQKTFISNGILSDLIIVVARTNPAAGHKGISLLVVERGMVGFERGRNLEKIGQHAQDTAELFFTDVQAPVANVLGKEGEGFLNLVRNLAQERLSIAIAGIAASKAALDWTLDYTKDRKAFGQPVSSFQNSKFKLAEIATEVEIGQVFVDRCLQQLDAGTLTAEEAAMAKWWCTELQKRTVDTCVQLHGGYGYMLEYPIGRAYTDARITTIYGGTTEIMKEIIGRSLGV